MQRRKETVGDHDDNPCVLIQGTDLERTLTLWSLAGFDVRQVRQFCRVVNLAEHHLINELLAAKNRSRKV